MLATIRNSLVRKLAAVLVLLPLLVAVRAVDAAENQDLDNGVVKLVVTTRTGLGRVGSGFLVRLGADHAYILTAAHVVEGCKETGVVFNTRRLVPPVAAKVVGLEYWDRRGLALLIVPASAARSAGARPLLLSTEPPPRKGAELRLIGHPSTVGDWSSLIGWVAAREGEMLKIQAAVNEGSSGGPVLRGGQVVGIVVAELGGIAVVKPLANIRTDLEGHRVVPEAVPPEAATTPPAELAPAPAKLTVRSNVREDAVYIDGKRYGPTRLEVELAPGGHVLRVEKEGYEPFETNIELAAGSEESVRAALQPAVPKAGETFRDCPACPEMVVIPAGTFQMGSPDGEKGRADDEGPVHPVRIAEAFALGTREVTVGEFRAFVQATGYRTEAEKHGGCWVWNGTSVGKDAKRSWRTPGFAQGEDHPVVCVSWNDARAYLEWLSKEAKRSYRLPSEAEWEYAARAGSTTARYWGEGPERACDFANVADEAAKRQFPGLTIHDCDDKFVYTSPVGSFKANALGLEDMLGNVWEWTKNCRNDSYRGAPIDGGAWTSGDCGRRVLRGGSWSDRPDIVRSAYRSWVGTGFRRDDTGFRPATTL